MPQPRLTERAAFGGVGGVVDGAQLLVALLTDKESTEPGAVPVHSKLMAGRGLDGAVAPCQSLRCCKRCRHATLICKGAKEVVDNGQVGLEEEPGSGTHPELTVLPGGAVPVRKDH